MPYDIYNDDDDDDDDDDTNTDENYIFRGLHKLGTALSLIGYCMFVVFIVGLQEIVVEGLPRHDLQVVVATFAAEAVIADDRWDRDAGWATGPLRKDQTDQGIVYL